MSAIRLVLVIVLWATATLAPAHAGGVDAVRKTGDVLQYALPGAAVGMTLLFQDYRGLGGFVAGFALNQGGTQLLKRTLDIERPNGKDTHSMPSGHTSASFQAAGFGQFRYGWAVGAPMLAAAVFTGWSRVYSNWHHPEDVIVGTALGLGAAALTTPRLKGRIRLLPFDGRLAYGLRLEAKF